MYIKKTSLLLKINLSLYAALLFYHFNVISNIQKNRHNEYLKYKGKNKITINLIKGA